MFLRIKYAGRATLLPNLAMSLIGRNVRYAVTLPESAITLVKGSKSLRKGVGGGGVRKWGVAEMVPWSVSASGPSLFL